MTSRPVVAWLTDFGLADPFVGIMKGVVLSSCPDANVVDVTHGIAPQAIAEGAFWLERSHLWFPPGTVFVAVVDPGVGSARKGVVLAAHGRLFVGPDNGLLGGIAASDPGARAFEIDRRALALPVPSHTFHGRDVFAKVAAELAAGRVAPGDVGPPLPDLVRLATVAAVLDASGVHGVVITVDAFGNAFTNVEASLVPPSAVVEVAGRVIAVQRTYSDVQPGEPIALVNAFDVLEIAVREGRADRELGMTRGAKVRLRSS